MEIIMNPRIFHLHDSHILASPCHIHIKTCYKLHAFFPFCRNKPIVRKYHTNLVFFFIKIFRKCTNNVCKPPVFTNGTHSDATKSIFFIASPPVFILLYYYTAKRSSLKEVFVRLCSLFIIQSDLVGNQCDKF